MARVRDRLTYIVPLTLFLVFLLLYFNTRSLTKTAIVALAVPFSAIGAVWYLYLLGYNMSIAVWVGLIALMGVDAETGVFMLLYLDLAYEQAKKEGRLRSLAALQETIVHGAAKRLRPKFMTVATTFIGFFPIMWATGTGSDVWKRIAAPMIGGIFTSFLLELVVYPAIYEIWKWHFEVKPGACRRSAGRTLEDGAAHDFERTDMRMRSILTLVDARASPALAERAGALPPLATDKDKLSYAMGMDLGEPAEGPVRGHRPGPVRPRAPRRACRAARHS